MPGAAARTHRARWASVACGAVAFASFAASLSPSHAQSPAAAAPDAQAQLDRGEDVYFAACVECHNADLTGGASHSAPPLVGPAFRARWHGRTARELLEFTRTTMPAGQPGSLDAQAYRDVVAFVLRRNDVNYGAGAFDAAADRTKLD